MLDILNSVSLWRRLRPKQLAIKYLHQDEQTTRFPNLNWLEVDEYSTRLAKKIQTLCSNQKPIVVYGHKHPLMLVIFLACSKSGHAYCPVDISAPLTRANDIINIVDNNILFDLTGTITKTKEEQIILGKAEIEQAVTLGDLSFSEFTAELTPVKDDEIWYIIFTSGSSGQPKGVQVTCNNLKTFCRWVDDLVLETNTEIEKKEPLVYLNQAPFSFDLSVMDLYLAVSTGGTLSCLTKDVIASPVLYTALQKSDINVWVSTPSFADLSLADKNFNQDNLPQLKTFLFCGETLTNKTYNNLQKRFPDARIFNSYGPTEATVAVSSILVTPKVSEEFAPLPVGAAKPGVRLLICKDGEYLETDNVKGEIVIAGDSVTKGYFGKPDLTDKVFKEITFAGEKYRIYHTGDEGYLSNGQLFYSGRLDFQIKLHGYRIELGDIENNLLQVDSVEKVAVLPLTRREKITGIIAYLKLKSGYTEDAVNAIKEELKGKLPSYMIPNRFVVVDTIPMTPNGKVDRRKLEEMV